MFYPFFQCISVFSFEGNFFHLLFMLLFCVGAGIITLMSILGRIGPLLFPSKDGKGAVSEGRNGRGSVYFQPESASFLLYLI